MWQASFISFQKKCQLPNHDFIIYHEGVEYAIFLPLAKDQD